MAVKSDRWVTICRGTSGGVVYLTTLASGLSIALTKRVLASESFVLRGAGTRVLDRREGTSRGVD